MGGTYWSLYVIKFGLFYEVDCRSNVFLIHAGASYEQITSFFFVPIYNVYTEKQALRQLFWNSVERYQECSIIDKKKIILWKVYFVRVYLRGPHRSDSVHSENQLMMAWKKLLECMYVQLPKNKITFILLNCFTR